jgi:glutamate N-acetyltransferase/amino-acid N-acetyltransferase
MATTKKRPAAGAERMTLPRGFRAAGLAAGIKKKGVKDMALLVSDRPAAVAGTFTTNQVKAAPVRLDMERLRGRVARAVIVNSGNANACNGPRGRRDAERTSAALARRLGVPAGQVFVCSTGIIGVPLPVDTLLAGLPPLVDALDADGGESAAEAILTTDTRPKRWTVELAVDGRPVRLSGMCKGAGMIEPKMATMLAFLVTDARVSAAALQRLLRAAVERSFNRITVDGDRSTNDTVLFFANGAAGNRPLTPAHPDWPAFAAAVHDLCERLAKMIVRDGEGATRVATIRVRGARSAREADLAARAVANSLLVKTAWAGKTANWGRVMDALGYSRARVVEEKVEIWFDELQAVKDGRAGRASRKDLEAVIARPEFAVDIDLHLGRGEAIVHTCNCTEDYVRVNV